LVKVLPLLLDEPQKGCQLLKSANTGVWAFGESRIFAKWFALKGLEGEIYAEIMLNLELDCMETPTTSKSELTEISF